MGKREKVIKGLECCSQGAKEPYVPTIRYCAECPYLKSEIPCTRALAREALELLKAQETSWISVKDRLPTEHDTIFAKLKGTDKWKTGMFEKQSDDVRVVCQFEDGTRRVWHDHTVDSVWNREKENRYPKRTVTHWCENPQLQEV